MKLEAEHKVAQLTDDISVLVVDDNEINLMLMEDILDVMDIKKVKTLESGIEAIKEIENNPNYDVVVMDICMPVMDGYEAAGIIRAMTEGWMKRLPILAMTANAFEEDRRKALEAGMDGHLAKPIDIRTLFETLYEILKE